MITKKTIGSTFGALSIVGMLTVAATQAQAHAQLVASVPEANAKVSAPEEITLRFNEALEARVSSFELKNADGDSLTVTLSAATDKMALVGVPEDSLSPGLYTINWTVAGADGHPMNGNFSFTVE